MFAGMTATMFDVTINNDQIFRGARMFQLSIDPSSLPSNVTIGDIGQATVTILDDDCKLFTKYTSCSAINNCCVAQKFVEFMIRTLPCQ